MTESATSALARAMVLKQKAVVVAAVAWWHGTHAADEDRVTELSAAVADYEAAREALLAQCADDVRRERGA